MWNVEFIQVRDREASQMLRLLGTCSRSSGKLLNPALSQYPISVQKKIGCGLPYCTQLREEHKDAVKSFLCMFFHIRKL